MTEGLIDVTAEIEMWKKKKENDANYNRNRIEHDTETHRIEFEKE
jgi:hypothetical protein